MSAPQLDREEAASRIGALTSLYVPPLPSPGLPTLLGQIAQREESDELEDDLDDLDALLDASDVDVDAAAVAARVDGLAARLEALLIDVQRADALGLLGQGDEEGAPPQGLAAVMARANERLHER